MGNSSVSVLNKVLLEYSQAYSYTYHPRVLSSHYSQVKPSSCNKECKAQETQNIYYLTHYRKSLQPLYNNCVFLRQSSFLILSPILNICPHCLAKHVLIINLHQSGIKSLASQNNQVHGIQWALGIGISYSSSPGFSFKTQ